jgi:signal transduction histidine kinase
VDNLLLNAVKYNVEDGQVRLGLDRRDQKAVLTVSDSGLGIARENMAKIFNRFYQANLTGTGRLEGLGIGLSLVQEIVLLHQGDIRVQSEPGQGTTFTVILESLP